jgi:hypothetical protein
MKKYYEIKPHQKKIIEDIRKLNLDNLYYLVIQQHKKHLNFSLNELKCHIKRGIKKYAKNYYGYRYKLGDENQLISYYTFFETSKDFNFSQHQNNIVDENINMNLHFHLFISSEKKMVCFHSVISEILFSFFSQKLKSKSLNKIDYFKVDKLEDDFILYHTKQQQEFIDPELILTNLHQSKFT